MRSAIHLSCALCLLLSLTAKSMAASPAESAAPARAAAIPGLTKPAPESAAPLDPNVFRYGPIQTKDLAAREQIEALYEEQWELQQTTLARLREINSAPAPDPTTLEALTKEGRELKQTLLHRSMEIGLEIAQLNGDEQRVADFEKALDQFLHPEKWMPKNTPDPELQARRMRELGIAK